MFYLINCSPELTIGRLRNKLISWIKSQNKIQKLFGIRKVVGYSKALMMSM